MAAIYLSETHLLSNFGLITNPHDHPLGLLTIKLREKLYTGQKMPRSEAGTITN